LVAWPHWACSLLFKALVVEAVDGDKIGKFAWKPLFFIIAANLVFGVMLGGLPSRGIPHMGLVVAYLRLVTFVASFAGDRVQPGKKCSLLATALLTVRELFGLHRAV